MPWLEVYYCRDIVLQPLHSAYNTETPPSVLSFAKSERRSHDNLTVSTILSDPSLLFLGVQSLHLRSCQAGGYGQKSGSGDASSQSWNPIHQHDDVQCLIWSVSYLDQCNNSLELQTACSNQGHSPMPSVYRKLDAFWRLLRPSM